mgnify:FL=1
MCIKPLGIFLFVTIVLSLFCKGQEQGKVLGQVNIASPNAAELGKYVDVPVDYNTGVPQISIPIYTIQTGTLALPISLSYHASGIKVMENSSWVGSGWSLNAGGAITRTVRGLPDDISGVVSQTKAHYVDYGYKSYLFAQGDPTMPSDNLFASGSLDGEPDLFFFNFNGISGKFYFNDDRSPVLVPEQDIKIEVGLSTSNKIEGFTIITSDGTK